jgi:hypothetical protein
VEEKKEKRKRAEGKIDHETKVRRQYASERGEGSSRGADCIFQAIKARAPFSLYTATSVVWST